MCNRPVKVKMPRRCAARLKAQPNERRGLFLRR
jgi:hypothetical protein